MVYKRKSTILMLHKFEEYICIINCLQYIWMQMDYTIRSKSKEFTALDYIV